MKTTIILEDVLYKKLVNEAIKTYGNAKNISAIINKYLREKLMPTNSMFGKVKLRSATLGGFREKKDRIDKYNW